MSEPFIRKVPKTIEEAIAQGFEMAVQNGLVGDEMIRAVRMEIQDFLAQKYVLLTSVPDQKYAFLADAVWEQVFPRRIRK